MGTLLPGYSARKACSRGSATSTFRSPVTPKSASISYNSPWRARAQAPRPVDSAGIFLFPPYLRLANRPDCGEGRPVQPRGYYLGTGSDGHVEHRVFTVQHAVNQLTAGRRGIKDI